MLIPEHDTQMGEEAGWEKGEDEHVKRVGGVSQTPGFLSQNAGLRDVPRPYVRKYLLRATHTTPETRPCPVAS